MSRRDLDFWPIDLELLHNFRCRVFKLCTKFERNQLIQGWVIDDLARTCFYIFNNVFNCFLLVLSIHIQIWCIFLQQIDLWHSVFPVFTTVSLCYLILLIQRRSQISTTVRGTLSGGSRQWQCGLWTAIEFYVFVFYAFYVLCMFY